MGNTRDEVTGVMAMPASLLWEMSSRARDAALTGCYRRSALVVSSSERYRDGRGRQALMEPPCRLASPLSEGRFALMRSATRTAKVANSKPISQFDQFPLVLKRANFASSNNDCFTLGARCFPLGIGRGLTTAGGAWKWEPILAILRCLHAARTAKGA